MMARVLALASLLFGGCVFAPLDLSEHPCPCGGGLVCDEARDRCVEPFDAGPDAGVDASMTDAGENDGGGIDVGPADSGPVDTGPVDAGGVDRIVNGSFEDTAGGWPSPWVFSVRAPAVATAVQSPIHAPDSLGAFSARITVTTSSTLPSDVQLRQDLGSAYVGETFTMRFFVRGDAAGVIEVSIQDVDAPYFEHCAPSIPVTTSWEAREVVCTLRANGDAGVAVDGGVAVAPFHVAFNLADEANVVYLDDVTFIGP